MMTYLAKTYIVNGIGRMVINTTAVKTHTYTMYIFLLYQTRTTMIRFLNTLFVGTEDSPYVTSTQTIEQLTAIFYNI